MPSFDVNVGGPQQVTQQISVQQPQQDPLAGVVSQVAGAATKAGLQSYAQGKIDAKVAEASGANLTNEQVQEQVDNFPQMGEMSPEEYQKASQDYLSSINASSKTLFSLVQNKQISSLQGESMVRKRLSEAYSNPFWASLAGQAGRAAGPLGGAYGASDVLQSPEMRRLKEINDAKFKQEAEFEAEIQKTTMATGLPEQVVRANSQEAALFEMNKAKYEREQATEVMASEGSFTHHLRGGYIQVTQMIGTALSEEGGTLGPGSMAAVQQKIAQLKAEQVAAVNSLRIPQSEKDARIGAIDAQYSGLQEYTTASSKQELLNKFNELNKGLVENAGTMFSPTLVAISKNFPDLAQELARMTKDKQDEYLKARFGDQAVDNMYKATSGMISAANLFNPNEMMTPTYNPSPEVETMLASPQAKTFMDKALEGGEKFKQLLGMQAKTYPTETLRGMNKGSIGRAARQGDENAIQAFSTAVGAALNTVKADRDILGLEDRIEAVPKMGVRGPGGRVTIKLPRELSQHAESLQNVYESLKGNESLWPEGATTAVEAFNIIVNGEAGPVVLREGARIPGEQPKTQGQMGRSKAQPQSGKPEPTDYAQLTSEPAMQDFLARYDAMTPQDQADWRELMESKKGKAGVSADVRDEYLRRLNILDSREKNIEVADTGSLPQGVSGAGEIVSQKELDVRTASEEPVPQATTEAPGPKDAPLDGPELDKPVDLKPNTTYLGEDAVKAVQQLEGDLTEEMKMVIREEGFSTGEYDDTKGISTGGVGQTGEFKGKTFKETFEAHKKRALSRIPDLEKYNPEARAALISAEYRGMLGASPTFRKLFKAAETDVDYDIAADEYLNAKDYRAAVAQNKRALANRAANPKWESEKKDAAWKKYGLDGVQYRMEREAEAFRNAAKEGQII